MQTTNETLKQLEDLIAGVGGEPLDARELVKAKATLADLNELKRIESLAETTDHRLPEEIRSLEEQLKVADEHNELLHEHLAQANRLLTSYENNAKDCEQLESEKGLILAYLRREADLYARSSRECDAAGNTVGGGMDAGSCTALRRAASAIENGRHLKTPEVVDE